MSKLVKVPFHEGEILAAVDERGEWVVIKPLCEALGIDDRSQRKRIMRQAWGQAAVAMMTLQLPGDGQGREVFCLHRKRVGIWLANLDVNRVKEAARPYLAALQIELADYLDAYFTKKPVPASEPLPLDPIALALQQNQAIGVALTTLQDQARRLDSVEAKVQRIEEAHIEAVQEMRTMERADGHAPEMTTRKKVVRLHAAYCKAKPAGYQDVWNWLYTELKYRHNFDAKIRAKNRNCKPLDVIEQDGMMQVFFILASDLLVVRETAAQSAA